MISPLNQRRWQQFKRNRRGWYSLWIFLVLFGTSLMAEVVANDKPLMMYHNGRLWFPSLYSYSEKELGGKFPAEALYWDPYVKDLVDRSGGWLLWPPIPFSYHTPDMFLESAAPAPPSMRHWLGTDDSGKDTVAQLIYGFRLSVLFGLALTMISTTIGISVGALQGYFGGLVDLAGQRLVEIWAGLPMLLLLIILASIVQPNVFWLLGTLALFSWMTVVGVVRAEFLRTRNFEYVRAAEALGDLFRRLGHQFEAGGDIRLILGEYSGIKVPEPVCKVSWFVTNQFNFYLT